MALSTEQIIDQTQCWIRNVIVAFNFCPFAKRELEKNSIYYKVVDDSDLDLPAALEKLMDVCFRLDEDTEIETSLLIFSNSFTNFDSFLELLELANDLLAAQNYEGVYQIASFHPDYCFAETELDDASNFTNRSPYPMLHLLRESSMEQALDTYPEPEQIPIRNIQKTREIGCGVFNELLDKCTKL